MTVAPYALEHGSSRAGRWLRARRLRLALWLAVAEGLLLVTDVVSVRIAALTAIAIIALYLGAGRRARSQAVRQVTWVGAGSQVLVAVVPALAAVAAAVALVAIAAVAVIALLALPALRR